MKLEIERKFLVRRALLPRRLPAGQQIQQGYLSTQPVVRVRLIAQGRATTAFLTIKGAGLHSRQEFEYPIPVDDARLLLKLCGARTIHKIRRRFGPWELDEFRGRQAGLWLAEIELQTRTARMPALPLWIGKEVTGDPRFSNARLAGSRKRLL